MECPGTSPRDDISQWHRLWIALWPPASNVERAMRGYISGLSLERVPVQNRAYRLYRKLRKNQCVSLAEIENELEQIGAGHKNHDRIQLQKLTT